MQRRTHPLFQKEKMMMLAKVGIWVAYLLVSFIFWHRYSYFSSNDTLSYFSIAKNYSNGYVIDAINACWSPLLSWLLIPFIKSGMNEFYALKLINIFCGIISLIVSQKIFVSLVDKRNILVELFLQLTLSALLLVYQVMNGMPDVLALTMVLIYIHFLTKEKPNYYFTGVAGALAYFAKAYNFFFFITSYLLFVLFEILFLKKKFPEQLNQYARGIFVFLFLSGIWISLLYIKYDTLTISSAGSYNTIVVQANGANVQPDWNKIIPPPNEHATSSWYDPTYYNINPRNPFRSYNDFIEYFSVLKINFFLLNHFLSCMSYFKIFWLILIPVFLYFLPIKNKGLHFLLFAFAFIYLMGYTLILIDERYILFSYFTLILLTFSICSSLVEKYPRLSLIIVFIPFIAISKNAIVHLKGFYGSEEALKSNYEKVTKLSNLPYFHNTNWISDYGSKECYILAYISNSNYYGFFGDVGFKNALTKGVDINKLDYYVSFEDLPVENTVFVKELILYEKPAKLYRFLKKEN